MNNKSSKQSPESVFESKQALNQVLLAAVCFLVFYPLFLRGLFFDKQMAVHFIFTAVLAAMLIAIKVKKRDYSLLSTSLDIAIFLYVIAYLLAMFKAIHIGDAAWGFLKALDYFLVYILVGEMVVDSKTARIVFKTLLAAGVGVAVIGLLAATGYSNYPGAFVDNHIMSTLQYHNTMAAFLGAMCFIGLALLLTATNMYRRLIYSSAIFLMALVTITAISKGALLIIVLAAGIFFLLLSGRLRWVYVFDFIYLYVLAFIFSSLFMQQITGGQSPGSIVIVVAGTILAMAGQLLKQQFSLRIRGRSLKKAALIILIVLAAGIGLLMAAPGGQNLIPQELNQEIKEIVDFNDPSYIYRADFIRWGLDIARDYPLTGTGAGGWKALLPQYQDYKYTAADAHNHMIQVLVETGIIGWAVFASIWVLVIMAVFKFRRKTSQETDGNHEIMVMLGGASVAAAAIGLHALIDFDLSIPAIFIVLVTLLALVNKTTGFSDVRQPKNPVQIVVLVVLVLILFISGSSFYAGSVYADKASGYLQMIEQDADSRALYRDAAIDCLEKAAIYDPFKAENQISLSRCYASLYLDLAQKEDPLAVDAYKKTLAAIVKAEKLMPCDTRTINGALNTAITIGNLEHSVRLARKMVEIEPNQIGSYEVLGEVLYGASRYFLQSGDGEQAEKYMAEVLELPDIIAEQQNNLNHERIAKRMGRNLKVSDDLEAIVVQTRKLQQGIIGSRQGGS
jgi:hypothetical protein